MGKLSCLEFLLKESNETVSLTEIFLTVEFLYGQTEIEDFKDFAERLNNIQNNHPVTIEYLLSALVNFYKFIPKDLDIDDALILISNFSHFANARVIGNFFKYVYITFNSIEEIKNANTDDVGVYYVSKFKHLQSVLAK